MANAYTEYLNTHYNPSMNTLGLWLEAQDQQREQARAEFEALLREQAARRAAAERAKAAAEAEAAAKRYTIIPPAPLPVAEPVKEDPSFLDIIVGRGIPGLGVMARNVAGLASDLLGDKETAQKYYDAARANQEVIDLEMPRQAPSFEQVNDLDTLLQWGKYTLGEALPQSVIPGGLGALGTSTLAKGVAQAGASLLGKELTKGTLRKVGSRAATAGVFGSSAALEGGQAWSTDVAEHGIENTSPRQDLLTGAGAGVLEAISPTGTVTSALFGGGPRKALNENILKALVKGTGIGALKEGSTEAGQEFLHLLNEATQDYNTTPEIVKDILSSEGMSRITEAAAAGTLFGPFGGVERVLSRRAPTQVTPEIANTPEEQIAQALVEEETTPAAPAPTFMPSQFDDLNSEMRKLDRYELTQPSTLLDNIALANDPRYETPDTKLLASYLDNMPETIYEKAKQERDTIDTWYNETIGALDQTTQQKLSSLDQQIAEAQQVMMEAANPNSRAMAQYSPEEREVLGRKAQNRIAAYAAQKLKAQEEYEKAKADIDAEHKKRINNATDTVVKNMLNLERNDMNLSEMTADAMQRANYGIRAKRFRETFQKVYTDILQENAARINEISNKLRNLTVGDQSVIRSMFKEQLDALRKQRKELVNSIRKVRSITDKLMKKHLQLDNADYTVQDAEMDFAELSTFAEDVPDANDLVDQIAKKYLQKSYDKAKMEAIRERRAARKAERREVFNETYPRPIEEPTEPVVENTPAPEQELYSDLQKTYSEALATNSARISDVSNRLRNMTTGDRSVIRSMFEEQLKALRDERKSLVENLRKASTAAANGDIDSLNSLLQQGTNLSSKADEVTAKYLKHSFTEARTQARRAKFADRTQTYQDVISDPASMTPKQTKEEKQFRKSINTAKAAIKPIIDAMPALKGKIKVIEQANDPNLANNIGFFTPEGDIYLNLTNVIEEARRTKKGVGAIASRALIHEAVVHYGLRAIFKQDDFNRFISLVDESFRNTRQWNQIASRIEGFDSLAPEVQAEEFLAKYSEQYDMNTLLKDGKSAWMKVMGFIKRVLRKIIPYKVTDEDVMNVLSAAAYRLSQNEAPLQTAPRSEGLARTFDPAAEQMSRTERAEAEAAQRFPFFNKLKEIYADRQDTLETFKEVVVDSFRPVERMVEDVKKLGKKADGTPRVFWDTNIYKLNQHLSSQQALALQQYHAKFVQPLLDLILKTGKTGEDASVTFARTDDYIEAVAALERNEYGMSKGLTKPLVVAKQGQTLTQANDYFRSVIAKYKSPEMDAVMTQLQKINNERLRLLEEFKIVPKEVIDAWRGAYKVYMPFKSWENLIEEADPAWYKSSTRKSLSTPGAQRRIMARATGRDGEAQSPITHAILQLYDVSNLTKTVEVGRSLLRLVKDNPDATNIFELVEYRDKEDKTWGRPTTYVDPETGHQVTEITHGFVKTVVDKKTGDISIKPTRHSAEGHIKDTVAVINEDGNVERVWIKDPGVARALKAENIARAGGVIRTIGTIQHTLGKYMTSRNPLFWITNPIRDTVTAAINISSLSQELRALGVQNPTQISTRILSEGLGKALTKNSVRNAIMYFRKHGTLDDVANAKSGLDEATKQYMADYEAYLAYGGQTEYFGTNTYETLSKDLVSTLRDKNPVTNAQKAKATINKMMDYFDEISGSLENMTRYIAFKEIVDALRPYADAGRTADGRPFSHEEMYSRAANVALNLTVNFSRKGAWAPIFNSLYMFASASIGGNVRMLETIFRKDRFTGKTDWGHVAKFMVFPLAAYVLQATLARAVMGDDDDGINFYDKIPEYIKSSNIIIPSPFGKGHYLTIPVAFGFDAISWNPVQKITDCLIAYATGGPGPTPLEAATSIVTKMFNNFATIGGTDEGWTSFVPTVVRPLVQLANNKNFAGNPIMPTGNENLRGNIPDHEKYWSTANQTVVELCKMMSPVLDISPESIEHLANAYLGGLGRITFGVLGRLDDFRRTGEFEATEFPGLKILYKTPQDSDTSALFSKYRTEALTQINAIEESKHNMGLSLEDRLNIVQENKTGYKLKKDLNKVQQQLNKIREMERKLLANSALSSSTKQKHLERLKKQKQQFMKSFISQANKAGL